MRKVFHFVDLLSRWAILRLVVLFALATLFGCNGAQFEAQNDGGRLPVRGVIQIDSGADTVDAEIAVDSRVATPEIGMGIDLVDGASCMAYVIANGYSSHSGSCATPPMGIGVSSDFTTPEEACKWAIDCYADNTCKRLSSGGDCSLCTIGPWSVRNGVSPWEWLGRIITPYCPDFLSAG